MILVSTGELPNWLEVLRHTQSKRLTNLSVDFEAGDKGDILAISSHIQYSGIHRTLTGLRLRPGKGGLLTEFQLHRFWSLEG